MLVAGDSEHVGVMDVILMYEAGNKIFVNHNTFLIQFPALLIISISEPPSLIIIDSIIDILKQNKILEYF